MHSLKRKENIFVRTLILYFNILLQNNELYFNYYLWYIILIINFYLRGNNDVKFLTKGDNNSVDDRGLYAPGQLWLNKKDIVGRAKGFLPYVGMITIYMNEYPNLKVVQHNIYFPIYRITIISSYFIFSS